MSNIKEVLEDILIEDFVEKLKRNAPRNKNIKHKHPTGETHLKDSIKRKDNEIEMNSYGRYMNEGTSKIAGTYFIDKAYRETIEDNKEFISEIMINYIKNRKEK
jgi:hypothetical protein